MQAEVPDNLFLLAPRNRKFVEKQGHIAGYGRYRIAAIILGVFVLIEVLAIIPLAFASPQTLFGVIFGLVVYGVALAFCIRALNRKKQEEKGQVVIGRLLVAHSRVIKMGRGSYYQVTLRYSFVTPSGHRLNGEDSAYRSDMRHGLFKSTFDPLPQAETPVAILYQDDQHFRVL